MAPQGFLDPYFGEWRQGPRQGPNQFRRPLVIADQLTGWALYTVVQRLANGKSRKFVAAMFMAPPGHCRPGYTPAQIALVRIALELECAAEFRGAPCYATSGAALHT